MKNRFIILGVFAVFFCKAQQIYPLNSDYEEIPNHSYMKDLNNELVPYIGTYRAHDQGNDITLFITKEDDKPTKRDNKQFYRDALVIKYIVKNQNNQVLQDTKNINHSKIYLYSYRTQPTKNTIIFIYSGTNCRAGWGDIYLKKINDTQISWRYRPMGMVITEQNCPGNPDTNVYLPDTKDLIFNKQ